MKDMRKAVVQFIKDEEGATAAEYGIIAAFMAAAMLFLMGNFRIALSGAFGSITTNLKQASSGTN